jgi:hypothetical protein
VDRVHDVARVHGGPAGGTDIYHGGTSPACFARVLEFTGGGRRGRRRQGGADEGLIEAQTAVVKRLDGGERWQRRELGANTEGKGRRLRIEGEWCGVDRGWWSPFIGG